MRVVGIRELKDRLSEYLKTVQSGETVLITDRGRAIAELGPLGQSTQSPKIDHALLELSRSGRLAIGAANDPAVYPELSLLAHDGTSEILLDELRGDH